MGKIINLLANYPKTKRDTKTRGTLKTKTDRMIARKFDKEFFDGDRKHGYGGYYYNPKFWQPVIPDIQRHFELSKESSVLDVGCGKGFMIHDMNDLIPGISVFGIDVSKYFTLSDYLASSIEGIRYSAMGTAFSLIVYFLGMHSASRKSYKQLEIEKKQTEYRPYFMLATLIALAVITYFKNNPGFYDFIFLIILFATYMTVPWISAHYFKEPRAVAIIFKSMNFPAYRSTYICRKN